MAEIAVIDDDPFVVGLLDAALSPQHHVVSYQSGLAAIEGLLRFPPEVVLLDIDLGDMSGVQLARAIREHAAIGHIPILAVTAHTEDESRVQLIAEGFTSFIAKPITDPQSIVDAVEAALAQAEPASWDEPADEHQALRRAARAALEALRDGDGATAEQILVRALADGAGLAAHEPDHSDGV
jgi:CheY-like chemotaxis protein